MSHRLAAAASSVAVLVTLLQIGVGVTAWSAQDALVAAARAHADVGGVAGAYTRLEFLTAITLLVSWVVTCLWLRSARATAVAMSPDVRQHRAAYWIWIGWLIPLVNFFFPYQVVRDIRRASVGEQVSSRPLQVWWGAWVLWLVADRAADRLVPASGPPSEDLVAQLGWVQLVVTGSFVVAAVCWLLLVTEIVRAQRTFETTR